MWWRYLGMTLLLSALAFSQPTDLTGNYSGSLGPLHLRLHLKSNALGNMEGTLDSPDQGANGLPCANFKLDGKNLSFDVPSVQGNWKGTISADSKTLAGIWAQGQATPLSFTRDAPEGKPSKVDGLWLGTLDAGGQHLRLQFHLSSDASGMEHCTLDSVDQSAFGIACADVAFHDNKLSLTVPAVHGQWSGTLSADGEELDGIWTQGKPLPLRLTRQKTSLGPKPPQYDPAMPPVSLAELKAVLDRDLLPALQDGELAPATGSAVVVGVIQKDKRQIWAYGPVKDNAIFEIGSITKTFTGLILAQMVEQQKVRFDEPVRELLPSGTVAKPEGPEITLIDLATQHSGLPRMPDNFHPADPANPYADYGPTSLYQFIGKHGVGKPSEATFLYSNLGMGLLGQALADRAQLTYPQLLEREITGPLRLSDTAIHLSSEQQSRLAQGHNGSHHPARAWDLVALAGAGAIRSTAADMLSYLDAQLHPEKTPGTLPKAIASSHVLRSDVSPGMKIALAWLYSEKTGNYWHNGATGGYSSYAFFNPKTDTAAIVLCNTTVEPNGSFADRLGEHVEQRLAGKPALSLAN